MAEINWYEKPLSVKTTAELSAAIAQVLPTLKTHPNNAKELISILLAERSAMVSAEEMERLQGEYDTLKSNFETLEGKTNGFQEENGRLLKEIERLQSENAEFTDPESERKRFTMWLKAILPAYSKPEDDAPEQIFERVVFVVSDLQRQVNELGLQKGELEEKLTAASKKRIDLGKNQAVITFEPEQLANIRKLKELAEATGHHFTTRDPNEVIHYVLVQYREMLLQGAEQLKQFQPLLQFLENE